MAISHRITDIASGVTTERCTADALRPGDLITVDTEHPADERTQAYVVRCQQAGTGSLDVPVHIIIDMSEVVGLKPVRFTAEAGIWFHRIVRAA